LRPRGNNNVWTAILNQLDPTKEEFFRVTLLYLIQ
jgi:hypothetical protein